MPPKPMHEFRKTYHFADFGCGDWPYRVFTMAGRNPRRVYLGVDPNISDAAFKEAAKFKNVHLVKGNAEEIIPLLHDKSLHIGNADFLFNVLPTREASHQVLDALRPKMLPNGRLYIAHDKPATEYLQEMLRERGYSPERVERIEKLNTMTTPSASFWITSRKYAERLRNREMPSAAPGEEQHLEQAWEMVGNQNYGIPMRLVARLKK